MNPLLHTGQRSTRTAGQAATDGAPPGFGWAPSAAPYFPNTRVASDGEWVSPLSWPGGPANTGVAPNDASPGLVPTTMPNGPWIVPIPSDVQGVGRSPGWQWPGRTAPTDAFNLDQLAYVPFELEQTGPFDPGHPWQGRNPPERQGWSAPRYYEVQQGYAVNPDSLGNTQDPQSVAYGIGWGYIE